MKSLKKKNEALDGAHPTGNDIQKGFKKLLGAMVNGKPLLVKRQNIKEVDQNYFIKIIRSKIHLGETL